MKIFLQTEGSVTLNFQEIILKLHSIYKKFWIIILILKPGTVLGWVTLSTCTEMWTRVWSWSPPPVAPAVSLSRATSCETPGCSDSNCLRTKNTSCWHSDHKGMSRCGFPNVLSTKDINIYGFQTVPSQFSGPVRPVQHRHWSQDQAPAWSWRTDQGSGWWWTWRTSSTSPWSCSTSAASGVGYVGSSGLQCCLCLWCQHLLQVFTSCK